MQKNVPTPYDDAFRTMLNDCPRLIIPLVNEVFKKNYNRGDSVTLYQNELFIISGGDKKVITDSNFSIGADAGKYLFECQSTYDGTIAVRVFEYSAQTAIREAVPSVTETVFTFPYAAVLDLRGKYKSDTMKLTVKTSAGGITYDVPVVRVPDYDLDEIFEKKLFFLIPFYIFRYSIKKLEKDEKSLEKMRKTYDTVYSRIDAYTVAGELTSYERMCIITMCGKVAAAFTKSSKKISEEVGDIMGGQILDYEAKDIFKEGISQGISLGLVQGILDLLGEFGAVPEKLRARISSEENNDTLKSWLRLAARTDSIEGFEDRM